jgi:hypothetical protein
MLTSRRLKDAGSQECHQSQHHERDSFHEIAEQGILGNDSSTEDCRHEADKRRSCNQEGALLDTCQCFFFFGGGGGGGNFFSPKNPRKLTPPPPPRPPVNFV